MCEGLLVTSYSRAENQRTLEQYTSLLGKDYDNYKTSVKYPASIKGTYFTKLKEKKSSFIRSSMEKQIAACENIF